MDPLASVHHSPRSARTIRGRRMSAVALTAVVMLAGCGAAPVVSQPETAGSSPNPPATPTAPLDATPSAASSDAIQVLPGEPWIVYQGGVQLPLRLVRPNGSDDHELLATPLDGTQGHPAWSPGGETIAFDVFTTHPATPGKERVSIWLAEANGTNARELAACELPCLQLAYPAWSPDGTQIALVAYEITAANEWGPSILQVLDVATGERRTVAASDDGLTGYYTPRWSPDGGSLVFVIETYTDLTETVTTGSAIAVVPADGSAAPSILTDPALFAGEPDWAPADRIIFGVGREEDVSANIMIVSPTGSDLRTLTSFGAGEGTGLEATWLPGGDRIMFVRGGLSARCAIAYVGPDGGDVEVVDWSLESSSDCTERTHAHLRPG